MSHPEIWSSELPSLPPNPLFPPPYILRSLIHNILYTPKHITATCATGPSPFHCLASDFTKISVNIFLRVPRNLDVKTETDFEKSQICTIYRVTIKEQLITLSLTSSRKLFRHQTLNCLLVFKLCSSHTIRAHYPHN